LLAPFLPTTGYGFRSRGTVAAIANAGPFAAPATNVVTGVADIAADICTTRVNGAATTVGTDQGTGNFGNYAINLGRRNNTNLPLNAYLTRLIICGATRSDSQIVKAERSTALKMGLPL
jgi:hypothetical protein